MNEETARMLGNTLLGLGLFCFLTGALMLVLGSKVDTTIMALGALALIFVGTGSSMKSRYDISGQ